MAIAGARTRACGSKATTAGSHKARTSHLACSTLLSGNQQTAGAPANRELCRDTPWVGNEVCYTGTRGIFPNKRSPMGKQSCQIYPRVPAQTETRAADHHGPTHTRGPQCNRQENKPRITKQNSCATCFVTKRRDRWAGRHKQGECIPQSPRMQAPSQHQILGRCIQLTRTCDPNK